MVIGASIYLLAESFFSSKLWATLLFHLRWLQTPFSHKQGEDGDKAGQYYQAHASNPS